jgi:hypothetical protein
MSVKPPVGTVVRIPPPRRKHTINLGLIAAREIEDIDKALADLLHRVSAEVELMERNM